MSNDVIITVKTKNETDYNPVKTALKGIEQAAASATASLASGAAEAGSEVASLGSKLASSAAGAAIMEGASTAASGGLNLLVSALGAVAAALPAVLGGFAALGPALLIAGGAAGAAATGLAAAGIGLATLAIGFGGIGAALSAHTKAMGGAGKAAVDTAEQEYQAAKRIKDAERNLSDAKRNEADAAKDVNRARQDEIDRLRELTIALEGQKAKQADAAQALIEAKEKQRRADVAGSEWEKAHARNDVATAQANYDAITEKLGDLSAEKQKAAKVGVDGSDQVQAALKREANAHESVIRAQEALADAHHKTAVASAGAAGGIDLFNQAMQKLSPNAQKLVYALLDIEKRFDVIKRKVQDHLLAGFDVAVKDLADKWLPHLDSILTGTADHLNKFGKAVMTAFGDSEFIKNIERAGKSGETFIDQMKGAVTALIDAFGRLAGHSGPVLKVIGKAIEGIFTWFDKWIKSADKSGKLDSFMKTAADTLQKVFDITGKVFHIFGQLIEIIFPSSVKSGNSILDTVSKQLDKLSAWLADPKVQKWIKAVAETMGELVAWLVKKGIPAIKDFLVAFARIIKFLGDLYNAFRSVFNKIADISTSTFNWIVNGVARFLNWISSSAHKIGNGLYGMWEGMRQGFRDVLNWIVDRWNSLSFTFPSFMGGRTIGVPHMSHFAHGGVASGLIEVGEHGRELIRVPPGSTVMPHGQSENLIGQGGSGGGRLILGFERSSGSKLMDAIVEGIQAYVKARGGNAQVALGRHGA